MSRITAEMEQSNELGFLEDASTLSEVRNACWGIGPLEVCANLISSDTIEITFRLQGIRIGSGIITAANNRICAGASALVVKADACVTADFANKVAWVAGKVCTKSISGGWSCREFKTKLISW